MAILLLSLSKNDDRLLEKNEFHSDLNTWLASLKANEKETADAHSLHFSRLYVRLMIMLSHGSLQRKPCWKSWKTILLSLKNSRRTVSRVSKNIVQPLSSFRATLHRLRVDVESAEYIDETSRLFSHYRTKFEAEIERKHKTTNVNVWTTLRWLTAGCHGGTA